MRRCIFFILIGLFFIFQAQAEATYRIYLENGSIISGIAHYEKAEDEIQFHYKAGIVGIPAKAVIKVEEYEKEEASMEAAPEEKQEKPSEPAPKGAEQARPPKKDAAKLDDLRAKLSEIEKRLAYIKTKEDKVSEINAEYDMTKRRLENLFQTGANKTQYQINALKKRKIEEDAKQLKAELEPLMNEKARLIEEKKQIDNELRASGG